MSPFFFQIHKLPLMIIPDVQVSLNGHAILTYTYNIYLDADKGNPQQRLKKDLALSQDKLRDPDYFGQITFHKDDEIFKYVCDGENELSAPQAKELIDKISQVRNNPDLWEQFRNK